MQKDDLVFVSHILESITKIEKYVEGFTSNDFANNDLVQDGVIRNFEIIGEATKHLSLAFREKHLEIPWTKIAGMRDILIHDYLGIDIFSVWNTIERDLPELKRNLEDIINNQN
jgi:uncharacterized protein with HEPN domain